MNKVIFRTGSAMLFLATVAVALLASCTNPANRSGNTATLQPIVVDTLQEGDVVQIVFPGATNLSTTIKIPLDGTVKLPFAGDFKAAGKTPKQLQADILQVLGPQLQFKEVMVTRVSSSASVYVSGAVLRPGKVVLERPLTVLEAIMECGGFDNARAKPNKVTVIRQDQGRQTSFQVDLRKALEGNETHSVYLKPSDVVHVPFKVFNL